MSPVRRFAHILKWAAIWICAAILIAQYWRKEEELRFAAFHHPLDYLTGLLDFSRTLEPDGSSDGRMNLEAERADGATPPTWQEIKNPGYSQGMAVYTTTPGARLSWPLQLPPGEYRVELFVYSYTTETPNTIELSFDNQAMRFDWQPRRPEQRIVLRRSLRINQPVNRLTLHAVTMGQPTVLVDAVSIYDVKRHHAMLRAKYVGFAGVFAAVLLLAASSFCWGTLMVRRLHVDFLEPVAHLLISIAMGVCTLGTVTTILGMIHFFNLVAVISLLVLGIVLGGPSALAALRQWKRTTSLFRRPVFMIACIPIAAVVTIAGLAALAPAAGVDPLIYHLSLGKWLIKQGGFEYHPYQLPWGYPHLIPNLFAIGQLLNNDECFRTAQLVHAFLGGLWIVSIYALGKSMFGRATGLAAAALCLSIEGVLLEMGLGLVDLGFAFLGAAVLLAFCAAVQSTERRVFVRLILIAAILSGGAAACKVNGPSLAIALGVAVFALAWIRFGAASAFACLILVAIVSIAVAMPMYLKNYLIYGNPFYPFPDGFPNRDLSAEFVRNYSNAITWDKYVFQFGNSALLTWPYLWVVKGFVDGNSPGPACLVGLLLLLAGGRDWLRRFWPLLILSGLLVPLWFFVSPLTRFAWTWLIVPIVLACGPLSERPVRIFRAALPIVLLIASFGITLAELSRAALASNNLRGLESDRAFLNRTLQQDAGLEVAPPMSGIARLNQIYTAQPSHDRVLIDTNLTAYADFPTIPAPYYIMAESFSKKTWARSPGPVCLSLSGKRCSDEEMLSELIDRLQVGHILQKKGMPKPEQSGLFPPEERFDQFIRRWQTRDWVTGEDLRDSILYSFTPAAREVLKDWTRLHPAEPQTSRETGPSK